MFVCITLSQAGHGKSLVVVAVMARCRRGQQGVGKLREHRGLSVLLPTGNLST